MDWSKPNKYRPIAGLEGGIADHCAPYSAPLMKGVFSLGNPVGNSTFAPAYAIRPESDGAGEVTRIDESVHCRP